MINLPSVLVINPEMKSYSFTGLAIDSMEVGAMDAENKRRLRSIANHVFDRETIQQMNDLTECLANNKEFCEIAGIDYENPPENIFSSTASYYTLKRLLKD